MQTHAELKRSFRQTGRCYRGVRSSYGRMAITLTLAVITPCLASTSARAEGSCASEALRQELRSGQLPDCRAYEIVSPDYKEGTTFGANRAGLAVSSDGEHLIAEALGAFAGVESEPYENTAYELSRTSEGWTAVGLDPPAAMSPESEYFGASADLTRTLWGLHRPSQSITSEDLYIREPDGRFVEVGPMVPPSYGSGPPSGTTTTFGRAPLIHTKYLEGGGASADLSHIFVTVRGEGELGGIRWPGDATLNAEGLESLYEYAGAGLARPKLVGLDNEGRQISLCGTKLGSASRDGDRYNAVSADGDRVFFTAAAGGCQGRNENEEEVEGSGPRVNELYARLDAAETVHISEPRFSQCKECQTGTATSEEPATTEEPAEFAGASVDGSKVFFTTEQELLPGQTTSNLYEYDFDNSPQRKIVLVSAGSPSPEVQGVARVSSDGSHVYFVAKGVLTSEPDDSLEPARQLPIAGAENLYAFERDAAHPAGHVAFVASLGEEDAGDWNAVDERPVQATPDGHFLVLTSTADLTPGDTSTAPQVFEYDAQGAVLVRVSVGQCPQPGTPCAASERTSSDGNTDDDPASIAMPDYTHGSSPTAGQSKVSLSDDGATVLFESSDMLTQNASEAASAGAVSIFEYRSDGAIANGEVYLISDGKDATRGPHEGLKGVELLSGDLDGNDVFFQTADPVLRRDTNGGRDIYDARVGGGFPEQVPPVMCEAEACRGALTSAPTSVSPGSLAPVASSGLRPQGKPGVTKKSSPGRAQKLNRALEECRRIFKKPRQRKLCNERANRRYGPSRKSKRAPRRVR
jgi:hypothetical protein